MSFTGLALLLSLAMEIVVRVNGTLTTHSVRKVNVSKAAIKTVGDTVAGFTINGRMMNCGRPRRSVASKSYGG